MSAVTLSPVGRLLRKPWYAVWRAIERALYTGRSYTIYAPFGRRMFTPWFELNSGSEFSEALKGVRAGGPVAVSVDRCYFVYQIARHAAHLEGEMAECGVYTGGTAHLIASLLASGRVPPRQLHLFDTFTGMPETSVPSRDYHSPGDFSETSLESVQTRLKRYSDLCVYHPGVMPATFEDSRGIARYSFVHVDVDIYPSVLDCCHWFWPRLVRGGVMVFDDYGFFPYRRAARAAVDEFFSKTAEQPVVLPTGQALVIKANAK